MNIAALLDACQKGFIGEALFNDAMNKIDLALFAKGVTVELGADKNWEVTHTRLALAANAAKKWTVTMGVGDGSGKLFVHGEYDSVNAVRAIVNANEKLLRWKGEIDQRRTLAGLPFPSDYDDSPRAAVQSLIEHHVLYANKCYSELMAAVGKADYRVLQDIGGKFTIEPFNKPRGFVITGLTNQQLAEHLVRHGTKDAEDVYDCLSILLDKSGAGVNMEQIAKHYCVDKMKGHELLGLVCQHLGIVMTSEGRCWRFVGERPAQLYSQEWWERSADGTVTFRRDANKDVPDWVKESKVYSLQCRVPDVTDSVATPPHGTLAECKAKFPGVTRLRIEQFDKAGRKLASTSTVDRVCHAVMRSDTHSVFVEVEPIHTPNTILGKELTGEVTVQWSANTVIYYPNIEMVPSHAAKLTPLIIDLLDALHSAIVKASPAKVD